MTRGVRIAVQAASMTIAVGLIVMMILAGIRGPTLIVSIVVITSASYTAIDSLQPDGRPREAEWLRRNITSNLVYVTVFITLFVIGSRLAG